MRKTPRNHGKPWTPGHDAQLRKLTRESTPKFVMGLELGRTEASVRSHAHQQGVSLKPTNQSLYNRRRE